MNQDDIEEMYGTRTIMKKRKISHSKDKMYNMIVGNQYVLKNAPYGAIVIKKREFNNVKYLIKIEKV